MWSAGSGCDVIAYAGYIYIYTQCIRNSSTQKKARHMKFIIPVISKYPSLVLMFISSGENGLTSRHTFQVCCPFICSHTDSETRPSDPVHDLGGISMHKELKRGKRIDPGQVEIPSLFLADSIQLTSSGSRKQGRSVFWVKRFCVFSWRGSQQPFLWNKGRGIFKHNFKIEKHPGGFGNFQCPMRIQQQ